MTAITHRAGRCLVLALLPVLALPAAGQDLAKLLPAETLAHVEFTGEPCHRVGGRLAIARMMAEPEVQQFLKSFRSITDQGYAQASQALAQVGLEMDDVLALTHGRMSISFLGMTQDGMPDVVITARCKQSKDSLLRVVDACAKMIGPQAETRGEITLAGRKGHRFIFSNSPSLAYVIADDMLVAGTNEKSLEQMLRRMDGAEEPNLAGTPAWSRVAANIRTKDDLIYLWADVGGLLEAFGPMMPQEVGMIVEASGASCIDAFGYAFTLEGAAFRDRGFVYIPEPKGLFKNLAPKEGSTLVADKIAPEDTVLFGTTQLDIAALFDWGLDFVDQIEPGAGTDVRSGLRGLSDQIGIDLEKDLIKQLGPEVAFYAALPGQALVPDVGLIFETGDPVKVEANLTRVIRGLGGIEVETFEYMGSKISYADLGALGLDWDDMPPLKPSWTLVNDRLVVTLWPQSAKNLVRGLKNQTPRLADNEDYKRLLALARERNPAAGNGGREYLDLKRFVGFVMDNGVPFAQSLIPRVPQLGDVKWHDFPSTDVVTRHLFGVLGTSTWTKDGVLGEYVSPTGIMPFYGALLAVGGFVAFQSVDAVEMMSVDRAMMDIETLKMAVKLFQLKEGRLPKESDWPQFLFEGSKRHPDPYIAPDHFPGEEVLDPWGNPYVYKKTGAKEFEILSYGADGKPGGEGDDADISSKPKRR